MKLLWCNAFALSTWLVLTLPLPAQEPAATMHFKPTDHALGDVHPFFRDGECFLYYLTPDRFEVALARSKDLIHWTAEELVHGPAPTDAWMKPFYVLGVFRDNKENVFRSFYGHSGRMVSSVSNDLLHWDCGPKELSIPLADYYQRRRDPYVFWIEESQEYGCVMTTWMKDTEVEKGGAISLATSKDLQHWVDHGPILYPRTIGEPECPQMFKLGYKWYLLTSIYDRAVGKPVYWMADSVHGPWQGKPLDLDGKDLCAAQVAFDGDRPIFFGWIPLKPSLPGNQTWGGHLALPRELVVLHDGTLAVKLANEHSHLISRLERTSHADATEFSLGETKHLSGSWNKLSLQMQVELHSSDDLLKIQCDPICKIAISAKRIEIHDASEKPWSETALQLPLDSRIPIHVLVDDDIVEVFVNETNSLTARVPFISGKLKVGFQAASGSPRVTSISGAEWAQN